MISAVRSGPSGMMFSRVMGLNVWPSTTVAVPSQLLPTTSTSWRRGAATAGAAAPSASTNATAITLRIGPPTGPIVTRLEPAWVTHLEAATRSEGRAPARPGAPRDRGGVVGAGVEAKARHHHVRVAAVGVDADPAAGAALAEAGQAGRVERRQQQAPAVERVGDGARAVVAAVEPGEAAMAAAPAVALADQPVGGHEPPPHEPRGAGGRDGATVGGDARGAGRGR